MFQLLQGRKELSLSERPVSPFPGHWKSTEENAWPHVLWAKFAESMFLKGKLFLGCILSPEPWWGFQEGPGTCVHTCGAVCVCWRAALWPPAPEMPPRPPWVLLGGAPRAAPNQGQLGSGAGCASLPWQSRAGSTLKNFLLVAKMFLSKKTTDGE